MIENTTPNLDNHKVEILGKINACLASLGVSTKWLKPPESLPEYQSLKGKKVVMLDDSADVIANFVPELMVATDGNMQFVLDTYEKTAGGLEKEILDSNADVVLLDYSLTRNKTGKNIAESLKFDDFRGIILGFSSETDYLIIFKRAGFSFALKKTHDPVWSVKEVARLVQLKTQKS